MSVGDSIQSVIQELANLQSGQYQELWPHIEVTVVYRCKHCNHVTTSIPDLHHHVLDRHLQHCGDHGSSSFCSDVVRVRDSTGNNTSRIDGISNYVPEEQIVSRLDIVVEQADESQKYNDTENTDTKDIGLVVASTGADQILPTDERSREDFVELTVNILSVKEDSSDDGSIDLKVDTHIIGSDVPKIDPPNIGTSKDTNVATSDGNLSIDRESKVEVSLQGSADVVVTQVSGDVIVPKGSANEIVPKGSADEIVPQGGADVVVPQENKVEVSLQGSADVFVPQGSTVAFAPRVNDASKTEPCNSKITQLPDSRTTENRLSKDKSGKQKQEEVDISRAKQPISQQRRSKRKQTERSSGSESNKLKKGDKGGKSSLKTNNSNKPTRVSDKSTGSLNGPIDVSNKPIAGLNEAIDSPNKPKGGSNKDTGISNEPAGGSTVRRSTRCGKRKTYSHSGIIQCDQIVEDSNSRNIEQEDKPDANIGKQQITAAEENLPPKKRKVNKDIDSDKIQRQKIDSDLNRNGTKRKTRRGAGRLKTDIDTKNLDVRKEEKIDENTKHELVKRKIQDATNSKKTALPLVVFEDENADEVANISKTERVNMNLDTVDSDNVISADEHGGSFGFTSRQTSDDGTKNVTTRVPVYKTKHETIHVNKAKENRISKTTLPISEEGVDESDKNSNESAKIPRASKEMSSKPILRSSDKEVAELENKSTKRQVKCSKKNIKLSKKQKKETAEQSRAVLDSFDSLDRSCKAKVCCFCFAKFPTIEKCLEHYHETHNLPLDGLIKLKRKAVKVLPGTHACKICGKVLKNAVLNQHYALIHYWKNKSTLMQCSICGEYVFKFKLRRHQSEKHDTICINTCEICGFSTPCKRRLRDHTKDVHHGIRKKCEYCDFETWDASTLRDHSYRHLSKKRFTCDHCQYECIQKKQLRRHLLRKHNITLPKSKPGKRESNVGVHEVKEEEVEVQAVEPVNDTKSAPYKITIESTNTSTDVTEEHHAKYSTFPIHKNENYDHLVAQRGALKIKRKGRNKEVADICRKRKDVDVANTDTSDLPLGENKPCTSSKKKKASTSSKKNKSGPKHVIIVEISPKNKIQNDQNQTNANPANTIQIDPNKLQEAIQNQRNEESEIAREHTSNTHVEAAEFNKQQENIAPDVDTLDISQNNERIGMFILDQNNGDEIDLKLEDTVSPNDVQSDGINLQSVTHKITDSDIRLTDTLPGIDIQSVNEQIAATDTQSDKITDSDIQSMSDLCGLQRFDTVLVSSTPVPGSKHVIKDNTKVPATRADTDIFIQNLLRMQTTNLQNVQPVSNIQGALPDAQIQSITKIPTSVLEGIDLSSVTPGVSTIAQSSAPVHTPFIVPADVTSIAQSNAPSVQRSYVIQQPRVKQEPSLVQVPSFLVNHLGLQAVQSVPKLDVNTVDDILGAGDASVPAGTFLTYAPAQLVQPLTSTLPTARHIGTPLAPAVRQVCTPLASVVRPVGGVVNTALPGNISAVHANTQHQTVTLKPRQPRSILTLAINETLGLPGSSLVQPNVATVLQPNNPTVANLSTLQLQEPTHLALSSDLNDLKLSQPSKWVVTSDGNLVLSVPSAGVSSDAALINQVVDPSAVLSQPQLFQVATSGGVEKIYVR